MPSNLPRFTFRADQELLDKLNIIAERESRTANKQLEAILKSFINQYELIHGEIKVEE